MKQNKCWNCGSTENVECGVCDTCFDKMEKEYEQRMLDREEKYRYENE